MAELNSWDSIAKNGLLSTTALLDLYTVMQPRRKEIEETRRSESIVLRSEGLPRATVRDQIPMDDSGLRRCLPGHWTPSQWYQLLNGKVFFWFTEDRLLRLLDAAAYRTRPHDVLEVDARALISACHNKIYLSPINSGCTKPFPHPRDEKTFLSIDEYPYSFWKQRRRRGERAVELAVTYSVPDIAKYVTRVTQMRGKKILRELHNS
jgi:hypothetical protein